MFILPQILEISSKNLLIDQLIYTFKNKLFSFIDSFTLDKSKNRYTNLFLYFQEFLNLMGQSFFQNFFEALDIQFKNLDQRKRNYFINKSNVERTIITIFGSITFKRTLYQHKKTGEYYFYLDDLIGLESYRNYDPLVRAILVQDSVLTNPNHVSSHSSFSTLNLKGYLKGSMIIPKQTIYKFKQETK